MNNKSIICVFIENVFPWEWEMPGCFTKNGWETFVVASEFQPKKTISERVLNRLPHQVNCRSLQDHPLFKQDVSHEDTKDAWILCSSNLVEQVKVQFPEYDKILYYQIGKRRSNNRKNYFSSFDLVFNKTGLTDVSIELADLQLGKTKTILNGRTTTDRISIHRNFRNAGYFATHLLNKIAGNQTLLEGGEDNNGVLCKISDSLLLFKLSSLFVSYAIKKAIGHGGKTSWETVMAKCSSNAVLKTDLSIVEWTAFRPYPGGQLADPFIWKEGNKTAMFYEYIPDGSSKGELHASIVDEDGEIIETQTVLRKDYHLAYPFVFKLQDQLYMIPDSGNNRTVDLYECIDFPFSWKYVKTLLQGYKIVDCTLLENNRKWWMFCNVVEHDQLSSFDHLHIFYTDKPISGDWLPHKNNPVVSNAGNARPAGRIFKDEDGLYRPSQNSAYTYGYGLNLNRIIELTEETYREEIVQSYSPWQKQMAGIHTLNFNNEWMVIDRKMYL